MRRRRVDSSPRPMVLRVEPSGNCRSSAGEARDDEGPRRAKLFVLLATVNGTGSCPCTPLWKSELNRPVWNLHSEREAIMDITISLQTGEGLKAHRAGCEEGREQGMSCV